MPCQKETCCCTDEQIELEDKIREITAAQAKREVEPIVIIPRIIVRLPASSK